MTKPRSERKSTASELAELRETVERLQQQIQILVQAIDALADELQWRNNQSREQYSPAPPFALHSMPADPSTDDWRINRVPLEYVQRLREQATKSGKSPELPAPAANQSRREIELASQKASSLPAKQKTEMQSQLRLD